MGKLKIFFIFILILGAGQAVWAQEGSNMRIKDFWTPEGLFLGHCQDACMVAYPPPGVYPLCIEACPS